MFLILCVFGEITNYKHETHRLKHSKWFTGNRVVWMKNVGGSIPPVAKLKAGTEEANISVWHFGQTEIKCRFCHLIVPKGHICKRAPPKTCFKCGENGHVKADCPNNDFNSEFPSLSSANAPIHPNSGKTPLKVLDPFQPLRRSPVSPINNKTKKIRRTSSPSLSFYGNEEELPGSKEDAPVSGAASQNPTDKLITCEVAFFTDDASKDMDLTGDDILKLNTTTLTKDKLNIQMAGSMLSDMSPERKENLNVAVLHVGAQNFPTKTQHEFESMFKIYQNFVGEVIKECPRTSIVISSVLPRAGDDAYKEAINSCIDHFNDRLKKLSCENDQNKSRLQYLDNDIHFKDEDDKVDKSLFVDPQAEGMQLNDEGRKRLKSGIIDAIKSVYYQDKLVDSMYAGMGDGHATSNS